MSLYVVEPHTCMWRNLKHDRMIFVCFQGKTFTTMVIQIYAQTSNAEEAENEHLCKDRQSLLELTPPPPKMSFSSQGTGMLK